MSKSLILVTGASGYLGLHVVDQLLRAGHPVRGTVRSLSNESKLEPIRAVAAKANATSLIELVEADLLKADSWHSAMKDVTIVIHVASPFTLTPPEDEQELIKPAMEGTLNVLNAAFLNKVERVVVTSSVAAVSGVFKENRLYTESDWPELSKCPSAYVKSKILAEKAAWNFVKEKEEANQKCFELAVVNPSFIFGPSLNLNVDLFGASETFLLKILSGQFAKIPNQYYGLCDVRGNDEFINA